MPDPLNPDCRNGKHDPVCAGDAWDEDTDTPTPCACPCHREAIQLAELAQGRILDDASAIRYLEP